MLLSFNHFDQNMSQNKIMAIFLCILSLFVGENVFPEAGAELILLFLESGGPGEGGQLS